jgi:hypothetical protein
MNRDHYTATIKKHQFFILTGIIIFVLGLDVIFIKLPIYNMSNRTSDFILGIFTTVVLISVIAQLLYLRISFLKNKINFGFFVITDTRIKAIAIIIQSIIASLLIITLIQIITTQTYYTGCIKYIIVLSSSVSIFFMSLLSIRFLLWYHSSKNRALLLYSFSTMSIIVNSILIILYSYLALLNMFQVMDPLIPSINNMVIHLPEIKNVYLMTSTVEFILIWLSSVLILKPFVASIGALRFCLVISIPNLFLISKFHFYQYWLPDLLINLQIMGPLSILRFLSLFEVSTIVVSAVVFGIVFWMVSKRISDNRLKHFVQISGIGICLLFLTSHITNLTLLPYPPFGLVSISFAGISSYLLFIGLYQAAIITSKNSFIRSLIHRSAESELRFIGDIAGSEMKHNITSQFKQVVKKYRHEMEVDIDSKPSDSDEDLKGFVAAAIKEREKYLQNATLRRLYGREESPFGNSWEKWVEFWWQWCYSFSESNSPLNDSNGHLSNNGQIHESVFFLAGTFGGTANRNCTVSKDNSIFFPILNDIVTYHTDPHLKNLSDLDAYAKLDLDHTNFISAKIDGNEIPNIHQFRVHTHLFPISVPDKNDKRLRVKTEGVSDGYWLFLKNLTPGTHKLQFIGEKLEFDMIKDYQNFSDEEVKALPKFRVEVTYTLRVI